MILLIDNYDSFTYNLFQYLGELGEEVRVVRNNRMTIEEIKMMSPEAIVISPGPGRPEQAGICLDLIKNIHPHIPILGICLGHQAIGLAFGATIVKAKRVMHGKVSRLNYLQDGMFASLSGEVEVMRYHSLVIEKGTLGTDFQIIATSKEDDEIMAIKHVDHPLVGLQFHPESIGTIEGKQLLKAFLDEIRGVEKDERVFTTSG